MADVAVKYAQETLKEPIGYKATIVDKAAKALYGIELGVVRARKDLKVIELLLSKVEDEKLILCGGDKIAEEAFQLEDAIAAFVNKVGTKYLQWIARISFVLLYDFLARSEIKEVTRRITSLTETVEQAIAAGSSAEDGGSGAGTSNYSQGNSANYYGDDMVDHEELVGFQGNIDELTIVLTDEDSPRNVSVCGATGLGKTALARKVYRNEKIRDQFDRFAWVDSVSQVRDVWEGILIQLCSEESKTRGLQGMCEEEIAELVLGIMKRHKCLVVFDDVFNFEIWGCIKAMIPREDETCQSKILITTCMTTEEVIKLYSDKIFFFELKHLDQHDGWELLKRLIHFDENVSESEVRKKLTELGEEMVKDCDGLPLAIGVLGGLNAFTRFDVNEWEKFCGNIKWHRKKAPEDSVLSLVLNLSYDEMPAQLKPCFLHLAHFPENYEMKAKELCQIWIAEQFVPFKRSSENDAYECLSKLVKRRLVQIRRWGSRGRIKTCSIHNSIRDFCLSKAKSKRYLQTVNFRTTGKNVESMIESSTSTCRWLAIYLNRNVDVELLPLVKKGYHSLRSFICFSSAPNSYYEKVMKPLFDKFDKLRVLKFENSCGYVGKLPKEIKKLEYLRYLSLKGSHVVRLPSSIGNLRYLQTLDLRTNWTLEFPNVIWKLVHLRHLYLPHRSTLNGTKLRLQNLYNLKTLVNISAGYCNLKDVMKLKNLIKLKVHVEDLKFLETKDLAFDQLESLALENCSQSRVDIKPVMEICPEVYKIDMEGKMEKLPTDFQQFPSNLMKLRLKHTCIGNDPMATLGHLQNLKILCLDYNAFEGDKMICSSGGFPRLESLSLVGLQNLQEWIVEEGSLRSLRRLLINYCYKLEKVSDSLIKLESLKQVVIQRMPTRFKMIFEEARKTPLISRNVTSIEPLD